MSASEKLTFKENGGPAFPSPYNSFASGGSGGGGGYSNQGMSLRDYFAAQAMEAIMSSKELYEYMTTEMIAIDAYDYADAMLERRK